MTTESIVHSIIQQYRYFRLIICHSIHISASHNFTRLTPHYFLALYRTKSYYLLSLLDTTSHCYTLPHSIISQYHKLFTSLPYHQYHHISPELTSIQHPKTTSTHYFTQLQTTCSLYQTLHHTASHYVTPLPLTTSHYSKSLPHKIYLP